MLFTLFLIPLVSATSQLTGSHDRYDASSLPASWYQAEAHPVHALFRRSGSDDGFDYPAVGTQEWSKGFPKGKPDASKVPHAWTDALDTAVKAGKIPRISPSTQKGSNPPIYPNKADPKSGSICSSSYQCRAPGVAFDAPSGFLGIGFDGGPQPSSTQLLQFLANKKEKATHFMIGNNILQFPQQFKTAFNQGNDIAVQSFSHPYMTTLSNRDVVAELGWTMELIRNSTGGRVPKFWRPPYGDSDNRVRAIAKEVFGLTTVMYNKDINDWTISAGKKTSNAVKKTFTSLLQGSKSNGLNVLEHEHSSQSVQVFIDTYPQIKQKGWKTKPITQLLGSAAYQNVRGNKVTPDDILVNNNHIAHPTGNSGKPGKPGKPGNQNGGGSKGGPDHEDDSDDTKDSEDGDKDSEDGDHLPEGNGSKGGKDGEDADSGSDDTKDGGDEADDGNADDGNADDGKADDGKDDDGKDDGGKADDGKPESDDGDDSDSDSDSKPSSTSTSKSPSSTDSSEDDGDKEDGDDSDSDSKPSSTATSDSPSSTDSSEDDGDKEDGDDSDSKPSSTSTSDGPEETSSEDGDTSSDDKDGETSSDNKDEDKSSEDKDGENKDEENKDGENKDEENKDGENKDGENKDEENKDGDNKDEENKDGEDENKSANKPPSADSEADNSDDKSEQDKSKDPKNGAMGLWPSNGFSMSLLLSGSVALMMIL